MSFLSDWHCNHRWKASGAEFKTYARCDVSPDNPLRQAYRCQACGDVKVEIVSTKRQELAP